MPYYSIGNPRFKVIFHREGVLKAGDKISVAGEEVIKRVGKDTHLLTNTEFVLTGPHSEETQKIEGKWNNVTCFGVKDPGFDEIGGGIRIERE